MTTTPPPGHMGLVGADFLGQPAACAPLDSEGSIEFRAHSAQEYAHICALSSTFAGGTYVRVPQNADVQETPEDPHGLKDAIQRSPYTQEQVIARTYGNPRKPNGLAKSTLTKAIRGGAEAWPTDETILILGEAMGAEPGHWPEYDLARAREKLNPRFIPRADALANYAAAAPALGLAGPKTARATASRVGTAKARKAASKPRGKRPASPTSRPARDAGDA